MYAVGDTGLTRDRTYMANVALADDDQLPVWSLRERAHGEVKTFASPVTTHKGGDTIVRSNAQFGAHFGSSLGVGRESRYVNAVRNDRYSIRQLGFDRCQLAC